MPILPFLKGEIRSKVNQLRDPYIFVDDDQRSYLLYAVGGEQAIGVASIRIEKVSKYIKNTHIPKNKNLIFVNSLEWNNLELNCVKLYLVNLS